MRTLGCHPKRGYSEVPPSEHPVRGKQICCGMTCMAVKRWRGADCRNEGTKARAERTCLVEGSEDAAAYVGPKARK